MGTTPAAVSVERDETGLELADIANAQANTPFAVAAAVPAKQGNPAPAGEGPDLDLAQANSPAHWNK